MNSLDDFKVGSPIWCMAEPDGCIGLRLDCGDGGALKLTREQAQEVISNLQAMLDA